MAGPGDAAANWIAQRQHGVITAAQAAACGVGRTAIEGRCRRQSWQRLHRGVFLVGALDVSERVLALAAVLACAPGAIVSHRTAGWLWGLLVRPPHRVSVTMLDGSNPGQRANVRVHRPRGQRLDVRWRSGIPLTTPIQTVLDLAGELAEDELEAAWALAVSRRLATVEGLEAAVAASPSKPGIRALRELARRPDRSLTRSGNERRLLRLVRQAQLPEPRCNVRVEGKELDLWWPDARLAVEVDAFGTHGSPASFEDDRRVDADLGAAGIQVLRFTDRRIRLEPHTVVAKLAASLALGMGGLPRR